MSSTGHTGNGWLFVFDIITCIFPPLLTFMAYDKQRLEKRNEHIRVRFRYHRKRNPKWTIFAVIDAVADELFLAPSTVGNILKQDETVPTAPTIIKHTRVAIAI